MIIIADATYGTAIDCTGSNGEVSGDYVHSLTSQLASDADGDYVGMAIIGQTSNEGAWQYSRGNWSTLYPTYDSPGGTFFGLLQEFKCLFSYLIQTLYNKQGLYYNYENKHLIQTLYNKQGLY